MHLWRGRPVRLHCVRLSDLPVQREADPWWHLRLRCRVEADDHSSRAARWNALTFKRWRAAIMRGNRSGAVGQSFKRDGRTQVQTQSSAQIRSRDHCRRDMRTAGAQTPLHQTPGFHHRTGRIFHGGLLGVQVIGEGDYGKEQNQRAGERQNFNRSTVPAVRGLAPVSLRKPKEESSGGNQKPNCIQ